jgi:hypothetical protein
VRFRCAGNYEEPLQHLFSGFPGGSAGLALLLLRVVFGSLLLVQGGFYLRELDSSPETLLLGLAAVAVGGMLIVGFLIPVMSALVALGGTGVGFSLLANSTPPLFHEGLPAMLAGTVLLAIALLGPGAFSVDALVFGRRKIIIPPSVSPRRE